MPTCTPVKPASCTILQPAQYPYFSLRLVLPSPVCCAGGSQPPSSSPGKDASAPAGLPAAAWPSSSSPNGARWLVSIAMLAATRATAAACTLLPPSCAAAPACLAVAALCPGGGMVGPCTAETTTQIAKLELVSALCTACADPPCTDSAPVTSRPPSISCNVCCLETYPCTVTHTANIAHTQQVVPAAGTAYTALSACSTKREPPVCSPECS